MYFGKILLVFEISIRSDEYLKTLSACAVQKLAVFQTVPADFYPYIIPRFR